MLEGGSDELSKLRRMGSSQLRPTQVITSQLLCKLLDRSLLTWAISTFKNVSETNSTVASVVLAISTSFSGRYLFELRLFRSR